MPVSGQMRCEYGRGHDTMQASSRLRTPPMETPDDKPTGPRTINASELKAKRVQLMDEAVDGGGR